jgi:hypothetical protein
MKMTVIALFALILIGCKQPEAQKPKKAHPIPPVKTSGPHRPQNVHPAVAPSREGYWLETRSEFLTIWTFDGKDGVMRESLAMDLDFRMAVRGGIATEGKDSILTFTEEYNFQADKWEPSAQEVLTWQLKVEGDTMDVLQFGNPSRRELSRITESRVKEIYELYEKNSQARARNRQF